MIKKIKNFICKLLGIKQCACPEDMDLQKEIPIQKEKPTHCPRHLYFRKSCPGCQELLV